MGILGKAAVGSLVVGLGAVALAQNSKALNKIKKAVLHTAKPAKSHTKKKSR